MKPPYKDLEKILALLLLIVFLCAICTACQVETPELGPEPDVESGEPLEESIVFPTPIERGEPLSYEEFFSVERPLQYYDTDWCYTTPNDIEPGQGIFLFWWRDMFNKKCVYEEPVNEVGQNLSNVYFIDNIGKSIVQIDFDGSSQVVLYASAIEMDRMRVFDDVIFFREGSAICRLYIPTGTVDRILENEYIAPRQYAIAYWVGMYDPISTTDIMWVKPNEELYNTLPDYNFPGFPPSTISFFYSTLTNKNYDSHGGPSDYEFIEDFYDQYLPKRDLDLIAMGIDPAAVSYRSAGQK